MFFFIMDSFFVILPFFTDFSTIFIDSMKDSARNFLFAAYTVQSNKFGFVFTLVTGSCHVERSFGRFQLDLKFELLECVK